MSKLFLIPNSITEENFTVPLELGRTIAHIRTFFVEEPKSARRLLKHLNPDFPLQASQYIHLNEHTNPDQLKEYVELIKEKDCGIISESGVPCVADPGSNLVMMAHRNNIGVIPLVGPSSILMALMASGLGGQNFAFNGYLPKEDRLRITKIKALEKKALLEGQTQIFMDTPYHNDIMIHDVLSSCDEKTLLCVACDITGPEQMINTRTVGVWKKIGLSLPKKPALFIISK